MGTGGALGASCERSGGRVGPVAVLRAVRRGWAASEPVRSSDDGEGAGVRVRDGGVLLPEAGAASGGGRGAQDAGGGELSGAPDVVRVPEEEPEGVRGVVRGGGAPGAGTGAGGAGPGGGGRDEGSREREQAEGDEPCRMGPEEARLEAEIADLLAAAEAIDAEEDERHGGDVRGDELPEELKRREDRLAAIRAAKARLEAEARERDDARGRKPEWDRNPKGGPPYKHAYGEPEAKDQTNFTDPESRIMRTSTEGYQQCYNAQAVVDGESQLVVGTAVTDNASDQGQLVERVDEVSGRCGETPGEVLADAGYCNEEDLAALEARGIDGYVALGREGKGAGKPDPEKQPARARMAKKLAAPEGRAVYAKRKWIAEAPIGWIKEAMGFRRFSLRGLENVRGEWDLVCLALNARRLHVLQAA